MVNLLRILAAAALVLTAFAASAFDRPFPAGTKRGKMQPYVHPQIVIDGKLRTLSAGARIWNTDNLIEMPAHLGDGTYIVNYVENDAGEIDRLWILTPEEARKPASSLSKDSETR